MTVSANHQAAWPYITEFKSPRWALFSQVKRVPDFYVPFHGQITRKLGEYEHFIARQASVSLEALYWYCILKKYTFSDIRENIRQKILTIVNEACLESAEEIGFLQKKGNQIPTPTISETFFAVSILSLLDQLPSYLQMNPDLKRREKIIAFVMNRNQKGIFTHCLDKHCLKCKDRETIFLTQIYAIGILDLIDFDVYSLRGRLHENFLRKVRRDEKRFPLKLLLLRYLGRQGEVSEIDLKILLARQKRDGGFNSTPGSALGAISDTFWITNALEAFKWLADYPKGKIYSFLSNYLKSHANRTAFHSDTELQESGKVLVLMSYVWGSLIDEIESLIFDKLAKNPTIDFDKFAEELGIRGAEQEVLNYINLKYMFKMEVSDNAINFGNYLRTLDHIPALFSKMIYERVKARPIVDLTELMSVYNRSRPRKDRITLENLQQIIDNFVKSNFLTGKILKRKRGLQTHHIFQANSIIANVLTVNAPLNLEQIEREKVQVREFEQDIENMTFEIQKSAQNIFREVESLIMVDEVPLAKQRLTGLIKNSLFDAAFFNKNVDKFQQEFSFLNAGYLLKDKVIRWEQVFGDLRRNFKIVEEILRKRIEEREKVITDRDQIEELERKVQKEISHFASKIGELKEKAYETFKTPVEMAVVQNFVEKILALQTELKSSDDKIAKFSKKIDSSDEMFKEARKDAVNLWLSKRDEAYEKLKEFRNPFTTWQGFHKDTLFKKKEIIDMVTRFKESIKELLKGADSKQSADKLDFEINKILEFLANESKQLARDLEKDGNTLKTFPGLRMQIEREWADTQQFVESNLHKVRGDILFQIETARENQIQDEFIKLIDTEIQTSQEFLSQGRNKLQEMLNGGQLFAFNQYLSIVNEIERLFRSKVEKITGLLDKNKQAYPNFEKNCQISIYKFSTFEKFFDQELLQLKNQVQTDIIKRETLLAADISENNVVDIIALAKKLNLNKKDLRARMQNMLSESVIDGELFETCQIFVKTENWFKIEKIRELYLQRLNLIQDAKNQIVRLYNTAIKNHTILRTREELQRRLTVFDTVVTESRLLLNQYVERTGLPPQNKSYQKIGAEFEAKIQENRLEISPISESIEKLNQLETYMNQKLDFLKTMLTSQIELYEQRASHDKSVRKVAEEFDSEVTNIRRNINSIEREVQTYCKNVWQHRTAKDVEPLLVDLKQDFYGKKLKIVDKFASSQDAIKERLNNRQNATYKAQMEKLIDERQENLNKTLGKIQRDIERKIDIKEFRSASEMLTRRVALFNSSLTDVSKEIKDEAGKAGKLLKGFRIKNKYVFDKWKHFKQEIATTVKEKVLALEGQILENYIKFTIKVFKDEYITYAFLAQELKLPKDVVKERLITLIGEGRLPGRIYPELEIYYQNPDVLDRIDRESLEVIKASNIRTYLLLNRLRRFGKQYGPIFGPFSFLATLTYILYNITGQNPWIFLIPIISTIAIFLYFMRKRYNEEKDYEEVSEPKED